MSHSTTTFDRIVRLYDRARDLLDKEEGLDADDQRVFRAIRDELDGMWIRRRAELTFAVSGPPRLISAPNPQDHKRVVAHGIAPLPGGR